MRISAELWPKVKEVFHAALEAPPTERARVVQERSGGDARISTEVLRLLASADEGGVLDSPAMAALSDASPTVDAWRGFSLEGRQLGPWRADEEIGRGGMGVVYAGRRIDDAYTKRVAIKSLALGAVTTVTLARFRRERQILAGLEHPHIAALLDGGTTDDGVPYLVMEFVTGERIDTWCDTHHLPIRQRLDLFRQVCSAIQYAHARLVIHRDLKPGNIMVTGDGQAKVLDFGVAKLLTERDDTAPARHEEVTRDGFAPLTTAYASPEQVRGAEVTTATDVYSLGVILYRLLAGVAPFDVGDRTPAQTLAILEGNDAPPPSTAATDAHAAACGVDSAPRLRRQLKGELDAIVLKALRRDPGRRYASVEALADDLLRYLKGLPVEARPDSLGYRLATFARRNRALVGAVATAALALLVGTGVSLWQAQRARDEARRSALVADFLRQVLGAGDLGGHMLDVPRLGPATSIAEMLDSAAAWAPRALSRDPAVRAGIQHLLANALLAQERYDAAIAQYDSAIATARTSSARETRLVGASARASQASTLLSQQRVDAADHAVVQALREFQALGDSTSYLYGNARVSQGSIALTRGKVAEAEAHARAALVAMSGAEAADRLARVVRGRARMLLGSLLARYTGRTEEGVRTLLSARATFDSLAGAGTIDEGSLLLLMSELPGATSSGMADSLGREAVAIFTRAAGPHSAAVAQGLSLLASRARLAGDTARMRTYIGRAVDIVRRRPDLAPVVRQSVLIEYSRDLPYAGRLDSGITVARGIVEERAGANAMLRGEALQLLGALLVIRGREHGGLVRDYREAERILLQADSSFRTVFPSGSFWPVITGRTLAKLYEDWGRDDDLARVLAQLPDSLRRRR